MAQDDGPAAAAPGREHVAGPQRLDGRDDRPSAPSPPGLVAVRHQHPVRGQVAAIAGRGPALASQEVLVPFELALQGV